MDLDLSDDQRLLKEMIDRFAADAGGVEPHRAAVHDEHGFSRETWKQMAELGLFSIPVAEEAGGLGGGGPELMIMGEAVGRHLLSTPFLTSAVVAGTIWSGVGLLGVEASARDAALGDLLDGTRLYALIDNGIVDEGGRLTGVARGVAGAGQAERLIVLAGDALYLVDTGSAGVSREDYPLHGGGRAADVRLDGVAGTHIGGANAAAGVLGQAADRRVVFLAAEALGAAEAAFETTVEYLKTRVQFGTTIGGNQSLQHRAAEMFVEIEQLRSAAILAACSLDEPDPAERERIMAAVSLVVARAARFVAQQTVQLHGGIGVTEEHAVGHWFLRLTAIGLLLGGDAGARTLAARGGFVAATPYWDAAV